MYLSLEICFTNTRDYITPVNSRKPVCCKSLEELPIVSTSILSRLKSSYLLCELRTSEVHTISGVSSCVVGEHAHVSSACALAGMSVSLLSCKWCCGPFIVSGDLRYSCARVMITVDEPQRCPLLESLCRIAFRVGVEVPIHQVNGQLIFSSNVLGLAALTFHNVVRKSLRWRCWAMDVLDEGCSLVLLTEWAQCMLCVVRGVLGSGRELESCCAVFATLDRTVKHPKGIAENVLVGIGKFVFPVDFIILDMPEDVKVPLIFGRPFLSTAHAKIDVFKRKITLRMITKDKIEFRGRNEFGNFVDAPVLIGNFYVITDFTVVEDMDLYHDEGIGDVIDEVKQEDNERCELIDDRESPICKVKRFEMIKYSFGQEEKYVAVKEYEYDDLFRTNDDACYAYQEIFRNMDEGWFLHTAYLVKFIMGDPNITMEEYSKLQAEKAQRHGRMFNWEITTYGKVYCDNLEFFTDFEADFPSIVYNDALTSNQNVSSEPTTNWKEELSKLFIGPAFNLVKGLSQEHCLSSISDDESIELLTNKVDLSNS
ncbi:putative reverse transcriptase domain-containing protein [Tanacetum coccineum]|uniref:Reverse transcriptase domain-containing protein n=1 Tax=Tanacetum coccineum TaxID=301880 RepID=A0ABQ5A657_9ASTR